MGLGHQHTWHATHMQMLIYADKVMFAAFSFEFGCAIPTDVKY